MLGGYVIFEEIRKPDPDSNVNGGVLVVFAFKNKKIIINKRKK